MGSEMCIRDRHKKIDSFFVPERNILKLGIVSHKKLHTLDSTQPNKPSYLYCCCLLLSYSFPKATPAVKACSMSVDMYDEAPPRMSPRMYLFGCLCTDPTISYRVQRAGTTVYGSTYWYRLCYFLSTKRANLRQVLISDHFDESGRRTSCFRQNHAVVFIHCRYHTYIKRRVIKTTRVRPGRRHEALATSGRRVQQKRKD